MNEDQREEVGRHLPSSHAFTRDVERMKADEGDDEDDDRRDAVGIAVRARRDGARKRHGRGRRLRHRHGAHPSRRRSSGSTRHSPCVRRTSAYSWAVHCSPAAKSTPSRGRASGSRPPPNSWDWSNRGHVVEANQVDVLTPPVFRDLEEVDDSLEARGTRDGRSDVGIGDREDRVHLDLAFVHPVSPADRHVGTHPDADAAGDLAAANPSRRRLVKSTREVYSRLTRGHMPRCPVAERTIGLPAGAIP